MATIFEPSKFQAEIIAMNFDELVATTNVEEIVQQELQCRNEKTEDPMISAEKNDVLIRHYYEKRCRIDEWWSCGLKHLKYKLCECKRVQTNTADAMVQSDVPAQKIAATQYEFDSEFREPSAQPPKLDSGLNVRTSKQNSFEFGSVIDADEDIEMLDVAENNTICGNIIRTATGTLRQPVSINDTNELNTQNMIQDVMDESTNDTSIPDSVESLPTEIERQARRQIQKSKYDSLIINRIYLHSFLSFRFRK